MSPVGFDWRLANLAACATCGTPAAWTCPRCGPKCADHVRRKRGNVVRFSCDTCREKVEMVRVRRSSLLRWRDRALYALTGGMLGYPLVAVALCALAFSTSEMIELLGSVLGVAVTLALGLAVARAAADGRRFGPGRLADPVEALAVPLVRGVAACWPMIVAIHVYVIMLVVYPYHRELYHYASLMRTLVDSPWFWFTAVGGILFVPPALLHALTAPGWLSLVNPFAVIGLAARWRREYVWLVILSTAGFLGTLAVASVTPRDWTGGLLTGIPAGLTGIVLMRLVGELVHLHAEAFNWEGQDDAWIDVGDPQAPLPEEVAVDDAAKATMIASFEGRIRAALDAKDARTAVDLFCEVVDPQGQLTQTTLMRVGQAAASLEEYKLALSALLTASREDAAESAKSLLLAAMIFDERLRDHTGAKRLYQQVMERFPDSAAAERARRELTDPRFIAEKQTG